MAVKYWNYEFIYYGLVLIALGAIVWYVDQRVRLQTWLLWCLLAWAILHLLGGMVPIPVSLTEPGSPPNLYNMRLHPWLPKYDQAVHAFGFGLCTLLGWRAMAVACAHAMRPTLGPLFAAVLMGMGLGAINEVIEFIATRIMPHTNVGGYDNTGWDLVSNLAGCLVGAIAIRLGALDDGPPSTTPRQSR
jgi:uncharacterized membrane protein YjdF